MANLFSGIMWGLYGDTVPLTRAK